MSNLKNQNKGKVVALITTAVILVAFIAYSLFNYVNALKTDNSQRNLATEIAYLGQGILRASSNILDKYDEDKYRQISDERNKLNKSIDLLSKGGTLPSGITVPAPNEYLSTQITTFQNVVNDIITNVNIITNEKKDALNLIERSDRYNKLNVAVLNNLSSLASGYTNLHVDSSVGSAYLSIIGNTYNRLNSDDIRNFIDDRNILDDDYISDKNSVLQDITQQVSEVSRLPSIIQTFQIGKEAKDSLTDNVNNLYSNIQNLRQEANAIMNIMPKIVSAKKYASQSDKLSSRLDESYMSLSLSLSSTNSGTSTWLIAFFVSTLILLVVIIYLFDILSKTSDVSENIKSEKKLRDYIRSVNEYLGSFLQDGKLKRNIVIKMGGLSQSNRMLSTLPLLKDIAHSINTENKDSNSLLKEIDMDTVNLTENVESMIVNDTEFSKKIDGVSPMVDDAKMSINEMFKSAKEINVEGVKNNIENSSEKINETISGFNRLKETMQESNKTIKKVSESTQGMSDSIDEIRRYSDKMQINALNTEVITDVIMSKSNDPELLNEIIKINSYIKNVREISTAIINQPLKKLEVLNSSTALDTGEAIRSLEHNIQEIVAGGESISKIQNLIKSINNELKIISQHSTSISENTIKSISKLEEVIKEFKDIKIDNRESMEDKNKMLIKIKTLNEKVSDKVERN
jgi:methyl-accepting chemotaxis protein/cell division protein FtsB